MVKGQRRSLAARLRGTSWVTLSGGLGWGTDVRRKNGAGAATGTVVDIVSFCSVGGGCAPRCGPSRVPSASTAAHLRSKEYLMHSKAQQDVLMRLISDPSTVEGQAALQAFARIRQIADDLQLPPNVVSMACQIAEILLTMREESEQGAYFQDYTLVVLVAFAANLSQFRLGDNYGLPLLAEKYGHNQSSMDQVFLHIMNALREYRSTMVKVKELGEEQV